MNRRNFFKWLGIGAATAAVAPKVLASPSYDQMMEDVVTTIDSKLRKDAGKVNPEYTITIEDWEWEPLYNSPKIMSDKVFQPGYYMMVQVDPKSDPVRIGDFVGYGKRDGTAIAFRSKPRLNSPLNGISTANIDPGNYGFIQIINRKSHGNS